MGFKKLSTFFQGKSIPQGATIVKLVTTQPGSGKPTAIITSSQGGQHQLQQAQQVSAQTPSNIMGISSVQPQGHHHGVSIQIRCGPVNNFLLLVVAKLTLTLFNFWIWSARHNLK